MQYIKPLAGLTLILSMLGGCSFVPSNQGTPSAAQKQNLPETHSTIGSVSQNKSQSTNPAPPSVNPYLSQKPINIPNRAQTRFDSAVKSLQNNKLVAAGRVTVEFS